MRRTAALALASFTSLLASLLALSSAGCVTAQTTRPHTVAIPTAEHAAHHAPRTAAPRDRVVAYAWVRSPDSVKTLLVGEGGEVLDSLDGIALHTNRGLVRVATAKVPVATQPCERYDHNGDTLPRDQWEPPQAGRATQMALETTSGAKVPFVTPGESDGANEIQHDAEVLASVGPYLFVRESLYTYACGAHGFTAVGSMVYDVEKQTPITIAPSKGDADRLKLRAVTRLSTTDDGFSPTGTSDVELTDTLVGWDGGRLSLKYQYTAGTCYACGDGLWSSYTKSVAIDAPGLPRELAPFATMPDPVRGAVQAAVQRLREKNPGVVLGGFTVPPA